MKSPHTSTEAHGHPSSATPPLEGTRDVLYVLANSIAQTAAIEAKQAPQLQGPSVPAEPSRELLTEKMLADRWVCSVARLQRWRTVGEGPSYLKIGGKVLYRLKDIEAYEEASLVRKMF